ncbi:MAG: hypothetical protein ACM65K_15975 [Microcoleus sp.]
MVQTIQARNIALNDLETNFKIEWIEDDQFFREWQDDLPEISEAEKQQLLAYMLANVTGDRPTYGLLTNGADFLFVKLVKGETTQYAFSRKFYLFNPGNELYSVLSILKRIGELNIGNLAEYGVLKPGFFTKILGFHRQIQ